MHRQYWTKEKITLLYESAFFELIFEAYQCHKSNFQIQDMELCVLCSIKTGACPEDCAYCIQSAHYQTNLKKEKLLDTENILSQAKAAKAAGAKRFCMGAAWRKPPKKALPQLINLIQSVKNLGLESCATFGMLDAEDACALKEAGLDYYNHNLDTSAEHYKKIVSTRSYQDRLDTIAHITAAGINLCCGGILGMGETRADRIDFLYALRNLENPPKSIPINQLIPMPGTPLENQTPIDNFEFIRTIAVTRLLFPQSMLRLSAGRENMSDEMQAFCFMAGANSLFIGDKLLTAKNPKTERDFNLLKRLNFKLPSVVEAVSHVD